MAAQISACDRSTLCLLMAVQNIHLSSRSNEIVIRDVEFAMTTETFLIEASATAENDDNLVNTRMVIN